LNVIKCDCVVSMFDTRHAYIPKWWCYIGQDITSIKKSYAYILWRSNVLDSGSWVAVAAITVDKTSPLLPNSMLVLLRVGLACFLLWTACTLDDAYLFTVTVSAINMVCPMELIASSLFSLLNKLILKDNEHVVA